MSATVVLMAHNSKKEEMLNFLTSYHGIFARYRLISTSTTAEIIQQRTKLKVKSYLSSAAGGDIQIAGLLVNEKVSGVFFFVDFLAIQLTQPDFMTIQRICLLKNIPLAINLATAEILAESLRQSQIAHLIFNPVAGQGNPAEDLKLITDLLSPAMELVVHQTTPELNGKKLARQLVAKSDSFSQTIPEVDLIIASGGDGTISAVAGELINTNIPLGIIPRGTANAFAFALDISNRLNPIRTACEVILAGKVRLVDAAICNKNLPMILLAGIGLEAETIAKVDREAKNRWGALAYIMAGIQQFNVQELFETKIEIEGVVKKFQAAAVTIANAAPATSVMAQGSGLVIANDGLLDITIAAPKNDIDAIASMVNLLGAALLRTPTTREDIINLQTRQIKITVNPPQKVVIDGELIEKTDCLEVECLPSSLKIFAPDKEN